MQSAVITKGLAITNPLVLYRALIATQRIEPNAAQYRLAAHLQSLYHRLKDYEPEVEYRDQLRLVSSKLETARSQAAQNGDPPKKGFLASMWESRERRESLALTRRLTDREAAISVQSPQGLLLHGEVGTGKSMLVDLLADALPTTKKRRWHFNTFMLELYVRLESARSCPQTPLEDAAGDYSLLKLARELIRDSPIIFLDEFQLPDRAASKILTNLLIPFFQLGGVLIATSNRMPEELSKAAGIEYGRAPEPGPRGGSLGQRGRLKARGGSSFTPSQPESDFSAFLGVLHARCEVWRLDGSKDWRRGQQGQIHPETEAPGPTDASSVSIPGTNVPFHQDADATPHNSRSKTTTLPFYMILPSSYSTLSSSVEHCLWEKRLSQVVSPHFPEGACFTTLEDIPWERSTMRVYGRTVPIPRVLGQVTMWSFHELCCSTLGPADYISLASMFHTLILTEMPRLPLHRKNEARRLISLLDALYEARCRLLVQAEAKPDDIFFPESQEKVKSDATESGQREDQIYPETMSEVYQDQTSPFRPNVSAYQSSASSPSYDTSPLPGMGASASRRSILADEDSDFGPLYVLRSSHRPMVNSDSRGRSNTDTGVADIDPANGSGIPNFQNAATFTGEDERFAYKRAVSRLWEMCDQKWWDRDEDGWWTPVRPELRTWERDKARATSVSGKRNQGDFDEETVSETSPFRTSSEPPPRFSWVHAWGMMKWGRKAGRWGEGIGGLDSTKKSGNS